MLETLYFGNISSITAFKKQELAEIKECITTLQSQEDVQEEDTDEYLRTILSEQSVLQYFTHAQHIRHSFSQYIIHDNRLVEFSFPYQVLTSHIIKGLKLMLNRRLFQSSWSVSIYLCKTKKMKFIFINCADEFTLIFTYFLVSHETIDEVFHSFWIHNCGEWINTVLYFSIMKTQSSDNEYQENPHVVGHVRVYVNSSLYLSIQPELEQYRCDIYAQNYSVVGCQCNCTTERFNRSIQHLSRRFGRSRAYQNTSFREFRVL